VQTNRRIHIEVFGKTYTFETQADEKQAAKVGEFVCAMVEKAKKGLNASGGGKDVAVMALAAMSIANEYLKLKEDHDRLLRTVRQRSQKLLDQSEEVVSAGMESEKT
jgi:cell division protein ZapA (FtsZ GTPase activity inhibitor)